MTKWNIQKIDNVTKLQKCLVLILNRTLISGFLETIHQRILFEKKKKFMRFFTGFSSRSDIKDYSKPAIQFERNRNIFEKKNEMFSCVAPHSLAIGEHRALHVYNSHRRGALP